MSQDDFILIDPKLFKPAWNAIRGIRPTKTTLPMIGMVHLTISENGRADITCTDLDICGTSTFQVSTTTAQTMLLPHEICDYIAGWTDGEVKLRQDNGRIYASHGRSRTNVATLAADDFSILRTENPDFEFEVHAGEFLAALGIADKATAIEEARFYLQGVLFDLEDDALNLVATNGHKLHLVKLDRPEGLEKLPENMLLHRDHAKAILRGFSEDASAPLKISGNERQITIADGRLTITGKQIEGTYPGWRNLVPKDRSDSTFLMDAAKLRGSIERLRLMKGDKTPAIRVSAEDGTLTLATRRTSTGTDDEMSDTLEVEENAKGDCFFAMEYLADAMACEMSANIQIDLEPPMQSMGVIYDDDRGSTYIIMRRRGF